MVSGAQPCVVVCTPLRLKSSSTIVSIAATTIGTTSGLQPAITQLMAIVSMVATPSRGWITPITSAGSRLR